MRNQVLSIEQMQELIELGIDTSKARLYLNRNFPNEVYCLHKNDFLKIKEGKFLFHFSVSDDREEWKCDNLIPTFTLQDILEMLPNSIKFAQLSGILRIEKDSMNYYLILYKDFIKDYSIQRFVEKSLLEAAFNMLKWCKQNNYI